mgnify:CR=1 FL=1
MFKAILVESSRGERMQQSTTQILPAAREMLTLAVALLGLAGCRATPSTANCDCPADSVEAGAAMAGGGCWWGLRHPRRVPEPGPTLSPFLPVPTYDVFATLPGPLVMAPTATPTVNPGHAAPLPPPSPQPGSLNAGGQPYGTSNPAGPRLGAGQPRLQARLAQETSSRSRAETAEATPTPARSQTAINAGKVTPAAFEAPVSEHDRVDGNDVANEPTTRSVLRIRTESLRDSDIADDP